MSIIAKRGSDALKSDGESTEIAGGGFEPPIYGCELARTDERSNRSLKLIAKETHALV